MLPAYDNNKLITIVKYTFLSILPMAILVQLSDGHGIPYQKWTPIIPSSSSVPFLNQNSVHAFSFISNTSLKLAYSET